MASKRQIIGIALIVAACYVALSGSSPSKPTPDSEPDPAPIRPEPLPKPRPAPKPSPEPKPKPRPRPWGKESVASVEAKVSGVIGPDGTEIACDLPGSLHQKNIASRGLGCCVFRSIDHAARYQNVPELVNFPEWMVSKGIEGGGYPSKVTQLMERIAKDKGVPVPQYIQVEGMDMEVLKTASKTGRPTSVTYSRSPTGRYGGSSIAHMVNLMGAGLGAEDGRAGGKGWYVVLDNNYIGADAYEWMTEDEFKRTYAPGWSVILLAPPPPPSPRNLE